MFCAYSEDLGPKLQTAGFHPKPSARIVTRGSIQKGLPLEKVCPSDLPYAVPGGGALMEIWTPLPEVLKKGLGNGVSKFCKLTP